MQDGPGEAIYEVADEKIGGAQRKVRLRLDSRIRTGNTEPGGLTTSKPSLGAFVREKVLHFGGN